MNLGFFNSCPTESGLIPFFENTVNPDQLASNEAILSVSTVFSILIVNKCLYLECCQLTE